MISINKTKLRPRLLAATCIWAALNLFHFVNPESLDILNERLVDRFSILKNQNPNWHTPYDDLIVHLDLNNTTLRALNNFHPSRAHYARVIDNLGKANVGMLMCDIIFAGETSEATDRALMEAVEATHNIVFGMSFRLVKEAHWEMEHTEDPQTYEHLRQSLWKISEAPSKQDFYIGIDPLLTMIPLSKTSCGMGFLTLTPDADGVIRRLPLIARFEDGFYPSFVLQAVCAFLKVGPNRIEIGPGVITLKGVAHPNANIVQDIQIPVDEKGCMRINFVGPWGRMKHYNFSDVYLASDDPDSFALWQDELGEKIVVLSDISTGSADLGQVPVDEIYPLSGVHANAVHTIISGTFLRETPPFFFRGIEFTIVVWLILFSLHRSAVVFAAGTTGIAFAVAGAAGLFFIAGNRILPVAQPILLLLLGWAGLSVWNAVENARTRAELERARNLAEHELEIGRTIQAGFLPAILPVPDGWQIAAHFQPAMQVSGDFYDVFEIAEGRYTGIVMADVCDHGVGSALFMALTRSLLRAFALQNPIPLESNPADIHFWAEKVALGTVRQTNEYIAHTHGEAGMFATLFFGILDPRSGQLRYVNGGHEPPMILRDGRAINYLKATGPAVGAMAEAPFRAADATLEPGDCLVLYTDGVTDATDATGAAFSKEQLLTLVSEVSETAHDVVARVISALRHHVGRGSSADDVTLLVVLRVPPNCPNTHPNG